MKAVLTAAFGAATMLAAASAYAQTPRDTRPVRQLAPETGTTVTTPYSQPSRLPPQTPRPLFSIGNLPVGIWAPIAPPYDSRANRNNAANPLWYNISGL